MILVKAIVKASLTNCVLLLVALQANADVESNLTSRTAVGRLSPGQFCTEVLPSSFSDVNFYNMCTTSAFVSAKLGTPTWASGVEPCQTIQEECLLKTASIVPSCTNLTGAQEKSFRDSLTGCQATLKMLRTCHQSLSSKGYKLSSMISCNLLDKSKSSKKMIKRVRRLNEKPVKACASLTNSCPKIFNYLW